MSKHKVLYVFGGEKASGAEIVIERLMSFNIERVEPHLFISPGDFASQLIADQKPYPITVVDFLKKLNRSSENALLFYLKAIRNYLVISSKVLNYCKINKINTIHANTVVPASYLIPAIIYSRLFGLKKKWLWSDHDLKYFSKLDNVFSALCVRLYNKTFTVSEAVKAKYGSLKSVVVLYNGLDLELFRPDDTARKWFRNANNVSENEIVLAIAATISPRKGQLQLIEVFKNVSTDFQNTRLLIAGGLSDDSPEYNQQVLKQIADNPKVSYIGHVNEMIKFYNGCDIIINNSSIEGSEPLGTTIYEAMACEKVVIASRTGGTEEIIDNGIDGLVFEPENKEALKKIIKDIIIKREGDFEIIRRNARRKVQLRFVISMMAKNYNELIS